MSNFGGLTTPFTPPAACSATNVYLSARDGHSMYMQAPTDTQLCFPSGYSPQVYGGYFSPAQCPMGYTTACISLKTVGTDHETIVTCCPSYQSTMFSCNTNNEAPWQSTLGCASGFTPTVTLTSITVTWNDITGSLSRTTETEGGMNAYSVQVRHRSGDFQTVTTETTTVHKTTTETTTGPTTTVYATTTTTLPVPGVTTTVPARDVDLLSPSAFVAAACTAVFFLIPTLAGFICFSLGRNDRRRKAREEAVRRNSREERPLLGSGFGGYQSTERRVPPSEGPPPPYRADVPSVGRC
ncbi:hypothetical protein QBC34DRAFT_401962 [Podospora aff. communis PSN243]|uniref:Uncharacterized protein n=1 Tax=Podospora aff. communis PSN243 TaxID=3040156 RepID=A0AAV9GQU8_9PEZI|nr:hypothetical protein QBC34DRAFT_401962 [Podospora aff. communis PSN243]